MKKARSRTTKRNSIGRHWNHQSRLEMLEAREMLAATSELVSIRLAATDLQGNIIPEVTQGESFLIKAFIDDRRGETGVNAIDDETNKFYDDPYGYFSAYFNVTYDSAGFDYDNSYAVKAGSGTIPLYDNLPRTDIDGFISRLGFTNVSVSNMLFPNEVELLSFRMIAEQPGVYDMAEAFIPTFHFSDVNRIYDPNKDPKDWDVEYVDGVPQLHYYEGMEEGEDLYNATAGADEYISLSRYGNGIDSFLLSDSQVYFQGVDLTVIQAMPNADFQVRYVVAPTTTSGGEVNTLPDNLEYIDEWSYFYVEVYAQAPTSGSSINSAVVELSFNPADFGYVRTVSNPQDSNIRYSVSSTVSDPDNGTVTVGFNTLSTDLGDDRYALLGRIELRSLIELPVDYTNGELQATPSSIVTLTDASATIRNKTTQNKSLIDGTTPNGYSFDIWPVIYDVGATEDRKVGLADFSAFVGQFGKLVNDDPFLRKFDFDNNGKIGLGDFSLFVQNFGQSASVNSTRSYPSGYPGDLGGAPLMGSSFLLEGEQVDTRQSSTSAPQQTVEAGPPQPITSQPSAMTNNFSSMISYPVVDTTSTTLLTAQESAEVSSNSEPSATADIVVSDWNDQSELIAMTSNDSEDTLQKNEDETDFVQNADEVLALWDDESEL